MVNQNVASMVVFSLSLWAVSNSFLYDRGRPTSSYRTGNLCVNHKSSIYAPARSTVARNRDRRELRSLPLALQVLPNNQWGLYAIIATSAATALRLERTTSFGKSLSGPVTAMLITAVLTNVGILPAEGSIHLINLQMFVLKLATPMLLFGADLKKIFRETGVMLKAFLLGTVGTLLGSLFGMLLLSGPLDSIGISGDSWKIASALTAKNIGGGLNFFAVADAVKVSPSALATGLAVDNLLGLLYFPFISWCGAPYDENRINGVNDNMGNSVMKSVFLYEGSVLSENIPSVSTEHSITHTNQVPSTMVTTASISSGTAKMGEEKERRNDEVENGQENIQELPSHSSIITPSSIDIIQHDIGNNQDLNTMDEVEKLSSALALAFTIAFIADMLSQKFLLPSIPISTLLTVIMATTFPKKLKMMIPSGELLGKLFLLFFFASVGNASGTIGSTFAAKGAASLLLYECILYIVHISFIIGVGRNILNIPMPDILLASNANIGNAATASSLATARGWKNRILPSILVGTLGNAFGTFAGLSLGSFCLKKIAGY